LTVGHNIEIENMSGIGFSRNAQIVTKQNKEMLGDRKTYGGGRQSFPKKIKQLTFKEADEESIQELRQVLKREKRMDRIKVISMFILILIITLAIFLI
jgi:hypothetical protein